MKDEETFELCNQVYEATGWGNNPDSKEDNNLDWYGDPQHLKKWTCPKYTSDYLLEKLPETLTNGDFNFSWRLNIKKGMAGYFVEYSNHAWARDHKSAFTRRGWISESIAVWGEPIYADTLTKAVLKITLILHKEGFLP